MSAFIEDIYAHGFDISRPPGGSTSAMVARYEQKLTRGQYRFDFVENKKGEVIAPSFSRIVHTVFGRHERRRKHAWLNAY